MKIVQLRIGLHHFNDSGSNKNRNDVLAPIHPAVFVKDKNNYFSEAIEVDGKYFYRIDGTTVEIDLYEYEMVLINPILYYFSTALKLHHRVLKAKEMGLGSHWPNNAAAPKNIFEICKTNS